MNSFETDCIKITLGDYNLEKFVVVTANSELYDEISDNASLNVLAIKYHNGRLYLKEPSVFVKSVDYEILQHDFQRLKVRLHLLNLRETDVGLGGDSLFAAVSLQLNKPYLAVRSLVYDKLRNCPAVYGPLVQGDYDLFTSDISQEGSWANSATLQAVADIFDVRIAVLSGCHDQFLMEWWPMEKSDTDILRVVMVGYLEGYCYTSLSFTEDPYLPFRQEENLNVDYLYQKTGQKLKSEVYQKLRGRYNIDPNDYDLHDTLYYRLRRRLKTYGFKEKKIIGEGDCFLRAMSYNAHGSQRYHKKVRKEIIQQLWDHPELYRNEVYENYLHRMAAPRTWGDATFLQAYTDLKKCRVTSMAPTSQEIMDDYHPSGFDHKRCEKDYFLSDCGIHNAAIKHDLLRFSRNRAAPARSGGGGSRDGVRSDIRRGCGPNKPSVPTIGTCMHSFMFVIFGFDIYNAQKYSGSC